MFLSNVILGHTPVVIRTIGSLLVLCRFHFQNGESCLDITEFHHVFVGFHIEGIPP